MGDWERLLRVTPASMRFFTSYEPGAQDTRGRLRTPVATTIDRDPNRFEPGQWDGRRPFSVPNRRVVHGTEHCNRKRRTFRLSAPPKLGFPRPRINASWLAAASSSDRDRFSETFASSGRTRRFPASHVPLVSLNYQRAIFAGSSFVVSDLPVQLGQTSPTSPLQGFRLHLRCSARTSPSRGRPSQGSRCLPKRSVRA
jgi:hypothetical protein